MTRTTRIALALVVLGALIAFAALGWRVHLVHRLREPVLQLLTDPESATFRNEELTWPWLLSRTTLCGEVNSRNRLGGMAGYTHFQAVPGRAYIESESENRVLDEAGHKRCG